MELFWSALLSGIVTGGHYALIGVGLALVFGAMQIVNLAHGEILVVGAFAAYLAYAAGVSLAWAVLLGMVAAGLVGILAYGLLLPIRREPPLSGMVLTYGIALILVNGLLELYGADPRNLTYAPFIRGLELGPLRLSVGEAVVFAVSLLTVGLVYFFLRTTWTGRAVRAVAQNRAAAATLGINPVWVEGVAFTLGALLAGLGGALLVSIQSVSPAGASLFTIKAFVVVVFAGLTSIGGVVLAGMLLGVGEALTSAFYNPALSELVAFSLFLVVLLARPEGLFGRR